MLKAVQVVKEVQGNWWTICPISGRLLKYTQKPTDIDTSNMPDRVKQALYLCDQPFSCDPIIPSKIDISLSLKSIERSYRILCFLRKKSYFLSLLYAGFQKSLFETTKEAMSAVLQLPENQINRHLLCLPVSLMAIKLSKSFKKNGVLIIGAFIPTGEMHAWVIEDDSQVNFYDRDWINFHPLLAYIKE
jgi:hypothetical protein